jgi:hypothetical protein
MNMTTHVQAKPTPTPSFAPNGTFLEIQEPTS